MKIKAIDTFVVRIPFDDDKPNWGAGFWGKTAQAHPGLLPDHPGDITTEYPPLWRNRATYTDRNEAVIVRITTDSGLTGWGEIHTPVAGEVSQAVVDRLLAPVVYGRDPLDIQPIWETMYSTMRLRGHSSGYLMEAISGVDIALWDIVGKAVQAPIAKLLGGMIRDRIPVYASSLPRVAVTSGEAGYQAMADAAAALVEKGYRGFKVKLGIGIEQDRYALEMLRDAVGPTVSLAVDVNGAYDLALARQAGRMMEAYNVWWLEEPLMPENLRDYARLAAFLDMPVAGGECLDNRWIFNDFLAAGALDIVQPDVGRAGGSASVAAFPRWPIPMAFRLHPT
ncbi:MAG: mandelate racemase/muconate lactonizing enzyme family protein [Chloroflexi bacterium]|nr:mandelate racemase/muconate lactonizing enzyme family protein [Chloroflexota bacterium]